MNQVLSNFEGMASIHLSGLTGPRTQEAIRNVIAELRLMPMFASISDDEAEEMARIIEEKYGISMGLGGVVTAEDFKPWLNDAKINGDVGDFYWGRYRQLLSKNGLPKSVIDSTDEVTDKILDRLGNPRDLAPWDRLGMVVGHVQSGKTANYTGLVCKAADAGYRLIVVIAGIHNNLRNQTQARIDEGFIGRDTGRLAHANKAQRQKIIGVGNFDQREFPVALTNTLKDFNRATATTNTMQLGQFNVPAILVIKKNTSTLKNLIEWLTEHSVQEGTNMVQQPMLLIDDEADNASINIKYGKDEVARINGQIRELLNIFNRSSYVGYTATPFANILIDPDIEHDEFKRDLFPRHFIIGLDAPTNYFGAQTVFVDDRDQHVRFIADNEDILPIKHKIDHQLDTLPGSLVDAVRTFVVARAIRNIRGQADKHASMLVNASRFTDMQGTIRRRIADLVERIRSAVVVDAGKGKAALKNPEIAALHDIWEREFHDVEGVDWPQIQGRLHEVLVAAQVIEVNASKRSAPLNYDQPGEYGITVIAVGGFSLSRGLTLEGLTVSYFLRNSLMYDTLMQMGRWFGYRPGYQDLCRVWMPAEGVGWYAHISEAMDDLQVQLKKMELAKATPEQFGLAVRAHPQALMVTARNKMGTGQEFPVTVGLAGRLLETTRIRADKGQLARNLAAGERLVTALALNAVAMEHRPRGRFYKAVPVALVREFLKTYRADPADPLTDPHLIDTYIVEREETELAHWDILLASAQKEEAGIEIVPGVNLVPFERGLGTADLRDGIMAISGASRRLGSPGDEQEGLTPEQIKQATEEFRVFRESEGKGMPKTLPDRIFREQRTRPLLILRLVTPTVDAASGLEAPTDPVLAWGISFPTSEIGRGEVSYVMGSVAIRQMFGPEDDEEEAAGDLE